MKREELTTLAPDALIEAVIESKPVTNYEEGLKQYDPAEHDVKKRPDKPTLVPVKGQLEADGITPKVETKYVPVTKIAVPIQKFVIAQRASFAVGNKVTFKANIPNSPVFEAAEKAWRSAKMQYLLKEIAIKMMSETEVALIWYSIKDDKAENGFRLRSKVISPSTGDALYPVFDEYNDMIAFGRGFKIDDTEYFDLYTDDELRQFVNSDSGWLLRTDDDGTEVVKDLGYGKIPIIYWRQEKPECEDVKDLIDARERTHSDFIDNNKYFGQPPLFFKGTAINMPAKGDPGMTFSGSEDADAKFLTGGNITGSRELEFNILDRDIFMFTRTSKIDLESLKGLGDISGRALDRVLLASHMAARDMQDGEFGRGVQRCFNFLLAVYKGIMQDDGVEAEPEFSLFRIDDAMERVELANAALGLVSPQRQIEIAGFADDAAGELKLIEAAKALAASQRPPTPPVDQE